MRDSQAITLSYWTTLYTTDYISKFTVTHHMNLTLDYYVDPQIDQNRQIMWLRWIIIHVGWEQKYELYFPIHINKLAQILYFDPQYNITNYNPAW